MPDIFLSYRREDSAGYAGRLRDNLGSFRGVTVFMDVTSLRPGSTFPTAIEAAVSGSDAVIVLIGKTWASAGRDGLPRIGHADDFVRREVSTALSLEKLVIPVLVGGASMPLETELPVDIRSLSLRQAVEITDTRWEFDVGRLAEVLGVSHHDVGSAPGLQEATSRTVGWTVAALLTFGMFCLLSLVQSDVAWAVRDSVVLLPLLNVALPFSYFMGIAPFAVFVLFGYLQIVLGQWYSLGDCKTPSPLPPLLIHLGYPFGRRIFRFLAYVYPLMVLTALAVKAAPRPLLHLGLWLLVVIAAEWLATSALLRARRANESRRLTPHVLLIASIPVLGALGFGVNFGRPLDLSEEVLTGRNFSGQELSFADLRGADLRGADFTGARLWGANLRHARLAEANLEDTDLWHADLRDVSLHDVRGLRPQQLLGVCTDSTTSIPTEFRVGPNPKDCIPGSRSMYMVQFTILRYKQVRELVLNMFRNLDTTTRIDNLR